MKPKKLPKLKPSERLFVENYVKLDFNGTQAVKKTYGVKDDTYASVKAVRLIGKDSVAKAIEVKVETLKSALIDQGITPQKIAKKIDVLLNAKEPIYKNNNESGEIELVGYKIDFSAVDKGLKHAKDIYGVEDLDTKPKGNSTYNFIFNAETQKEIKSIEDIIKARLINPDVKEN